MSTAVRQWPKCAYRYCFIRPDPSCAVSSEYFGERLVNFCSECCRVMAKHEAGVSTVPNWLYNENLKKFYNNGNVKRYHQE